MDYPITYYQFNTRSNTWEWDRKKRDNKRYSGAFKFNDTVIYIKEIIYSNPATIVFWSDGSRTVVRCSDTDTYSEEVGLVMCILKKQLGTKRFKQLLSSWVPVSTSLTAQKITLSDVIKREKHG